MNFRAIQTAALALFVVSAGPSISRADNVYTFESPQFTVGEATPIGPTAPNSGDPSFTTSFAANGDPGAGTIVAGFPSPLFSGQSLATGFTGLLTLTFSAPVSAISVDFGLDAAASDPSAFFELVTPLGTLDQANTSPGGLFAGGVLTFTTTTPFTTASLEAFSAPGTRTLFGIDNLDLSASPLPEPFSLTLLATGLAGLVAVRRRQKQTA